MRAIFAFIAIPVVSLLTASEESEVGSSSELEVTSGGPLTHAVERQGRLWERSKGVCGDRRYDLQFPWNGRVKPSGQFGFKPFLKYIRDHYKEKFASLKTAVDHVASKTRQKRSGQSHLVSETVAEVLERMRGFEKCRGFTTVMDSVDLYAGHSDKRMLSTKEDTSPAEYGVQVHKTLTEGDDCCDEDCKPWEDSNCRPCGPVCQKNADGTLARDATSGVPICHTQTKYCFEKCSDFKCEVQGECDCKDDGCRPCLGLKSMARYVAKELKITLSFDVCGKAAGGGPEREKVTRQMCSVFRPDQCSIDLAHLLMRGDSKMSVREHNTMGDPLAPVAPPAEKPIDVGDLVTVRGLTSVEGKKLNGRRVTVVEKEEAPPVAVPATTVPADNTTKTLQVVQGTTTSGVQRWVVSFSDGTLMSMKATNLAGALDLDVFHYVFGAQCTPDKLDAVKAALIQVKMGKREGLGTAKGSLELLEWAERIVESNSNNFDGDIHFVLPDGVRHALAIPSGGGWVTEIGGW